MSGNNTPALNTDGTLKDASEIEWIDSPSEDNPLMPSKSKKRKRPESTDTIHLGGYKNLPPHREAGKRMKKVSERGKAAVDQLNPQQRHFFSSNFGKFAIITSEETQSQLY
jgi:hypothetical protein